MESAQLRSLFDWGRCQSCMMVSEGWDPVRYPSSSCPNCGDSTFGLEWPPEPAGLLLRQALKSSGAEATEGEPEDTDAGYVGPFCDDRMDCRDLHPEEQGAIRGLLSATALDVMLEWVFRSAIESFDSDSLEVARLTEPTKERTLTTQERIDLIYKVAGLRLRDVAEREDEPRFVGLWKELQDRRDAFLHAQSITAFADLSEEQLLETINSAVKVLAAYNNALW